MAQKVTEYTLPAAGGAPTIVKCTMVTSRMEIIEDGSVNAGVPQGLIGSLLYPTGFGTYTVGPVFEILPGTEEPYVIAGYPGDHPPNTAPIGNGGSSPYPVSPGGPVTTGTRVAQFTSATASTTKLRVTEWS